MSFLYYFEQVYYIMQKYPFIFSDEKSYRIKRHISFWLLWWLFQGFLYSFVAINSALQVDLTGQSTAESLGKTFYSGMGGQASFMRGAVLSKRGRSILVLPSTANNGTISRIVPFLSEGAGITLNRGDIHYVVTEYGIAYLHGKNIIFSILISV